MFVGFIVQAVFMAQAFAEPSRIPPGLIVTPPVDLDLEIGPSLRSIEHAVDAMAAQTEVSRVLSARTLAELGVTDRNRFKVFELQQRLIHYPRIDGDTITKRIVRTAIVGRHAALEKIVWGTICVDLRGPEGHLGSIHFGYGPETLLKILDEVPELTSARDEERGEWRGGLAAALKDVALPGACRTLHARLEIETASGSAIVPLGTLTIEEIRISSQGGLDGFLGAVRTVFDSCRRRLSSAPKY